METVVTMNQMKEALHQMSGSKFPVKITFESGEEAIRYVRGFADARNNILLVSETAYSLAMKIIEVKEIAVLAYAEEKSEGKWVRLVAKWRKKKHFFGKI